VNLYSGGLRGEHSLVKERAQEGSFEKGAPVVTARGLTDRDERVQTGVSGKNVKIEGSLEGEEGGGRAMEGWTTAGWNQRGNFVIIR